MSPVLIHIYTGDQSSVLAAAEDAVSVPFYPPPAIYRRIKCDLIVTDGCRRAVQSGRARLTRWQPNWLHAA